MKYKAECRQQLSDGLCQWFEPDGSDWDHCFSCCSLFVQREQQGPSTDPSGTPYETGKAPEMLHSHLSRLKRYGNVDKMQSTHDEG